MPEINSVGQVSSYSIKEVSKNKSLDVRTSHRFDFDKCVNNALNKNLKISAHAIDRLNSRNISLSESDMKNINNAIDKVEGKGSKEALILYNDLALIASVKNRTIITAMDKNSLEEKVFTNIDAAVIL
ncbi:TIGR02530 family flagellar biosynthesis protein [Clostridium cylindrosporum]|uniref:Flagellar operon protein n=1 Tax=Clostridium cylindrosporum DSM 605 TaxID=1121307 RepID=A0A0J8G1S8_CLOCY|nr:TIGR02530 family flagellar biosynthesis protein [Clostridium cylindrosporum]KMT21706.1 flagellar operon protein [Clostridium cylindrosporum DSM 605]